MSAGIFRRPGTLRFRAGRLNRRHSTGDSTQKLRVLFCGSDDFSATSLKALVPLTEQVESIEVVCKPPRRHGRNKSLLWTPPIREVAQEYGLPIHEINTFTGWSPPGHVDLVVAVSFGLLVPRRILAHARYGGVNVHPSLLPDLRGAAPIHWALTLGNHHSGVTLQTLHPTRLDHGEIIDQTPDIPLPGFKEPDVLRLTTRLLADAGAELLRRNLVSGAITAHVLKTGKGRSLIRKAPKITSEHLHLGPEWGRSDIVRRAKILGPLWDDETRPLLSLVRAHDEDGVSSKTIAAPRRMKYADWRPQTLGAIPSTSQGQKMETSLELPPQLTRTSEAGNAIDDDVVRDVNDPKYSRNLSIDFAQANAAFEHVRSWAGRRTVLNIDGVRRLVFRDVEGYHWSPDKVQVEGRAWQSTESLLDGLR